MSRYAVVTSKVERDPSSPNVLIRVTERHPDCPAFESWSEADLWLQERFLNPAKWRVDIVGDA